MDGFEEGLRQMAEIASFAGDSLAIMARETKPRPSREPALTCDVCGYVDDTEMKTAVSEDEDGVIRCEVCRKKKQQGTSGYVHIPRRRRGKGDKTP